MRISWMVSVGVSITCGILATAAFHDHKDELGTLWLILGAVMFTGLALIDMVQCIRDRKAPLWEYESIELWAIHFNEAIVINQINSMASEGWVFNGRLRLTPDRLLLVFRRVKQLTKTN